MGFADTAVPTAQTAREFLHLQSLSAQSQRGVRVLGDRCEGLGFCELRYLRTCLSPLSGLCVLDYLAV